MEHYDFIVVGAGMAGASIAAELAASARVLVLEMEDRPGYHATGRSAAFWTESYGGPQVQPLTTASGPFLRENRLMSPRGALTLAKPAQREDLEAFATEFRAAGVRVELVDRSELERRIPGLQGDWQFGAFEPDCCDIDVAGLHLHYLKEVHRRGGRLRSNAGLAGAVHEGGRWTVTVADGSQPTCNTIVNASGAWADLVAKRCSVPEIGILPMRRTVAQLRTAPRPPAELPLVLDIAGQFYFKPEGQRLWLSPHDETPSPPCDAAPEELDIAYAIDRFEQVVDWKIEAVEHRWAGLRSFAPDRLPVYGRDPHQPAFAWFAGQGGFGIQTAPAAARLAAALLLDRHVSSDLAQIDAEIYSPARFSRAG